MGILHDTYVKTVVAVPTGLARLRAFRTHASSAVVVVSLYDEVLPISMLRPRLNIECVEAQTNKAKRFVFTLEPMNPTGTRGHTSRCSTRGDTWERNMG